MCPKPAIPAIAGLTLRSLMVEIPFTNCIATVMHTYMVYIKETVKQLCMSC